MPLLISALLWTAPALADDALRAESDAATANDAAPAETRTPEQKRQTRNTVVLMAIVTGIALTGLLLVIIAIAARGLSRKMAKKEIEELPTQRTVPKTTDPTSKSKSADLPTPSSDQALSDAHSRNEEH
jgi:hypothetical protein